MNDDFKQTITNFESTLIQIQDKIKSSNVLNGGFSTLMEKVTNIEESQEKILDEVNSLKEIIYHPDNGLFSRIKNVDNISTDKVHLLDKSLSEIKIKQENDLREYEKLEKNIQSIENLADKIEDITKWKTNFNKLLWAITIPIFTTFIKIFYDFFAAHVQLK